MAGKHLPSSILPVISSFPSLLAPHQCAARAKSCLSPIIRSPCLVHERDRGNEMHCLICKVSLCLAWPLVERIHFITLYCSLKVVVMRCPLGTHPLQQAVRRKVRCAQQGSNHHFSMDGEHWQGVEVGLIFDWGSSPASFQHQLSLLPWKLLGICCLPQKLSFHKPEPWFWVSNNVRNCSMWWQANMVAGRPRLRHHLWGMQRAER